MDFSDIKGFGEKRINQLKEAGFYGPADLLTYFPSKYIDTTRLSDLSKLSEGDDVIICACTLEKPKLAFPRRGLSIVKVKFIYNGKTVWASWFNQRFMARNIVPGRYYYITGKLKKFKTVYEISAPQLIRFTGESLGIIPIYKPIGKVGSSLIADAVKAALTAVNVNGYVPNFIAKKYGLMGLNKAFEVVHQPQSMEQLSAARKTLDTERLSYMLCAYSIIKEKEGNARLRYYTMGFDKVEAAIDELPYKLTSAQEKAVMQIFEKLRSEERLNVLLEGDVGCGKTVVAFLAMYLAAINGHQAVMIAPTEILATQHYEKALEFFTKKGIDCAFLSSSLSRVQRESELYKISSGSAKCVFGTHSLLNPDVCFDNLAMVVIDEQHRFGVAQRARLENKAQGADCIVMSATPIPRTLALTLYGDLAQIIIDEKPLHKAKTITRYVPPEKEKAMWEYILSQANEDGRTFIVAPKISDDEDGISAETIFKEHVNDFGDKLALLHGKIKDNVKSATMRDFSEGKIKALVATTVIEVGIDVPEATTMIIYEADRFGLSQLHQLRGRVGRGSKDSYCFVLTSTQNAETKARLEKFISSNDGFELAEYDFKSRGAGDFLGYSQHGVRNGFVADPEHVALCKSISIEMLTSPDCRIKVEKSLATSACDYFSEITLN